MATLTELIKKEIKRQYGSVKAFAGQTGISYGTINTALYKGIGGSSFDFVMKVCNLLDIKQIFNTKITQVNGQYYALVNKLKKLDLQGIATVTAIINVELDRCSNKQETEDFMGYNGIGYVEQIDNQLKKLVQEVIEDT